METELKEQDLCNLFMISRKLIAKPCSSTYIA